MATTWMGPKPRLQGRPGNTLQ